MSPCGWSNLMMVVGATAPDEARRIRAAAPKALFLVPGYGAQGADPGDALAGLIPRGNHIEGGVVSASRSVNFPASAAGAESVEAWQDAIAAAIDDARAGLDEAVTA
jgi:orotidine-5'-phosphate decarboxylase